jgi:hypothetical protein
MRGGTIGVVGSSSASNVARRRIELGDQAAARSQKSR